MNWESFYIYAAIAGICWLAGTLLAFRGNRGGAIAASTVGSAIFLTFIAELWISLERPPLRTMGETRLWYSFFLSVIGIFLYARNRYSWMLAFGSFMSIMFACINIAKPEIHSTTLMPALQSPWFVPHVIVYMFSYAMMGAATLFALYLWFRKAPTNDKELSVCDSLVRVGWSFLSLGMVMGALWAKEAWGDYWTWDPKETWALATWLSYLLYLHMRPANRDTNTLFALLVFSFILLQMCWWGINFLPSAKGASVHIY
ncbi:MAG: cytochrome c biogenesis protein CcsA [Bacteroidaceae bacterium]|nr:cytochrome c biogenesis protein CcsA [Bacteroidaceae bacterium]